MPRRRNPYDALQTFLIEDVTRNTAYRRVLQTGEKMQLVAMSIPPRGEIGEESHGRVEQLFIVVNGFADAVVNGERYELREGDSLLVPRGAVHNVFNPMRDKALKLLTIYSPPQHPDGTVHRTRAEAERG